MSPRRFPRSPCAARSRWSGAHAYRWLQYTPLNDPLHLADCPHSHSASIRVYGRHLSDLQPEEAMRMTYMSVEAVTAGLVLTGQAAALDSYRLQP